MLKKNNLQQIAKTPKGLLAYFKDFTRNKAHQIIDLVIGEEKIKTKSIIWLYA